MKVSTQILRSTPAVANELNLDVAPPEHVNGTNRPKHEALPITQFGYPEDDDPNCLLGNDGYLSRGGGMLFVSYAGVGKSSFIMAACMSWALGMPWVGLRCSRPLKSLIIQAEDSPRYIGKVQASFAHATNLSPAQIQQVGENCIVVRMKGVAGDQFFVDLKELVEFHKPDLVVINPIYMYAEGDIGRSEFAQPFISKLDATNHKEKFAYILVHHTGKPAAKGPSGKRAESEDWESVYMGFGSSYLANWPRCSAMLEPSQSQGKFTLKLGKGRFDAGITKEVDQGAGKRDEVVTKIHLKHSRDTMPVGSKMKAVIHWEVDAEPDASSKPGPEKGDGGRPPKWDFKDFGPLFPAPGLAPLPFNEVKRLLETNGGPKNSSIYPVLGRWVKDGLLEKLADPATGIRFRRAF